MKRLAIITMFILGAFALAAPAQATGATIVPLHNTTAGSGECPISGPNGVWHFVSTPNNDSAIVSIKLKLNGTWVTISSWTASPKVSHAYVAVPNGYTLTSLQAGEFGVTGTDDDVKLSHTCGGTTTTTTTTSTTSTTTSTSSTTTTTPDDEETTTTVKQTTTTTTEPEQTTTTGPDDGTTTTSTVVESTTTTIPNVTTTTSPTTSTIVVTGSGLTGPGIALGIAMIAFGSLIIWGLRRI